MIINLTRRFESHEPVSDICHQGNHRSGICSFSYTDVLRQNKPLLCCRLGRHTGRIGIFCRILAQTPKGIVLTAETVEIAEKFVVFLLSLRHRQGKRKAFLQKFLNHVVLCIEMLNRLKLTEHKYRLALGFRCKSNEHRRSCALKLTSLTTAAGESFFVFRPLSGKQNENRLSALCVSAVKP
jgi:hypothetical protein